MEQPRYLIDTNAIIDYLGKKLPDSGMNFMNTVIDAVPIISVISKIEVLSYNAAKEHYHLLTDFMEDAVVIDLTPEVVEHSIATRKIYKTKLPDAIIAATALANGLLMISRNIADFKNINGLQVIDPWNI
jgi:predicted nucleic acid-binding protein